MSWLETSINKQRSFIEGLLLDSLTQLAEICATFWADRKRLDEKLKDYLEQNLNNRCRLLYAIDANGFQYSSNISDNAIDESVVGQDLANRPYLERLDIDKASTFILSDVYIDKRTRKPCITAMNNITRDGINVGYIAADFDLKDLPLKNVSDIDPHEWRQIKGDPSIRGPYFSRLVRAVRWTSI